MCMDDICNNLFNNVLFLKWAFISFRYQLTVLPFLVPVRHGESETLNTTDALSAVGSEFVGLTVAFAESSRQEGCVVGEAETVSPSTRSRVHLKR